LIRLLAIDMDGTCLNDKKEISAETMGALRAAARAGITVVPTTGRTVTCLPHQLRDENFFRYVISSNGAAVTDTETGTDLHRALLPNKAAVEFMQGCDRIHVLISAHINHRFVLQGHVLRFLGRMIYGKDAASTDYSRNIAYMLSESGEDVEEIQLFYFSEEKCNKIKELASGYDFIQPAFSDNYAELYTREASKGNALLALADYLKIPEEEIACIGDEENDLSMFEKSGLKFAMGNAIPELKAGADFVVPDNNSSGVAAAIQNYILGS
jgi:Cof subfamily protein (haloacid dehalogenase superfamily)